MSSLVLMPKRNHYLHSIMIVIIFQVDCLVFYIYHSRCFQRLQCNIVRLLPFLNDDSTPLKLRQITEYLTFIA